MSDIPTLILPHFRGLDCITFSCYVVAALLVMGIFIPVAILEHDVDDGDVDDDDDDPNPTLFNEHEPFSFKCVVNNVRHLGRRFESKFAFYAVLRQTGWKYFEPTSFLLH